MIYTVSIKAFGHVRVWNYEAADEAEAVEKAQAHAGYELRVTPRPDLDETHTGGVAGRVDEYGLL